jgi:hypothetical protein
MDGTTPENPVPSGKAALAAARELLERAQKALAAAEVGGTHGWGPFADIVIMDEVAEFKTYPAPIKAAKGE